MSLKYNDLLARPLLAGLSWRSWRFIRDVAACSLARPWWNCVTGRFNLPKTLLISFTVTVMFWTPTMT